MSEQITKRCPDCGAELVIRVNGQNGSEFLSCTRWAQRDMDNRPLCSWTGPVPQSVYMRRAGAAELPEFNL
jgi:ssDNA-binding Zn-finger/Zn-ribbon topoisomerase 1